MCHQLAPEVYQITREWPTSGRYQLTARIVPARLLGGFTLHSLRGRLNSSVRPSARPAVRHPSPRILIHQLHQLLIHRVGLLRILGADGVADAVLEVIEQ